MSRIKRHLTYANVMVTILAVLVIGGGGTFALAAGGTKAIKKVVASLAPGLSVRHASSADNATNATHAANADHAVNADNASNAAAVAAGAVGTSQVGLIPAARVNHHDFQAVPNSGITVLTFDEETFDNDNLHSTTSNTNRMVAPVAGLYQVNVQARWQSAGTGTSCEIRLIQHVVGVTTPVVGTSSPACTAAIPVSTISTLVHLRAGDYMDVDAQQNSTGTINISGGDDILSFSMAWLGP
jgi:hypothetical protein